MKPGVWKDYLLPKEPEKDPAFRQEIARLSVVGMRVIAGVSASAGVLGYFLPALSVRLEPNAALRRD